MTNQKLYALKTSDTGEWVRYEDNSFIVFSEQEDNSDLESLLAIKNTGKPCEWVEVMLIDAKPVTDEVIDNMNDFGAVTDDDGDISSFAWEQGFRAACEYMGVKVEED